VGTVLSGRRAETTTWRDGPFPNNTAGSGNEQLSEKIYPWYAVTLKNVKRPDLT